MVSIQHARVWIQEQPLCTAFLIMVFLISENTVPDNGFAAEAGSHHAESGHQRAPRDRLISRGASRASVVIALVGAGRLAFWL